MTQTNHPSPGGDDLMPCPNPWCRITPIAMPVFLKGEGWRVYCDNCGISAPRCRTEAEARAAWNQRPPTTGDSEELARVIRMFERALEPLPYDSPWARDLRRVMAALTALRSTPYGGEAERYKAALEQIELQSTNIAGDFDTDPWAFAQALGNIARTALGGPNAE